ncbi:MAG: short-chain dehydrogenase/reductase [Clostridia bacterium]|nr:short-chain dehydrogenase/reductase [Clostridia bacterium]
MSIGNNLEKLFSLEGKVILLTGAVGGIGRVIAKGLSDVGASLALCDIAVNQLEGVSSELSDIGINHSYKLNLLEKESIKECIDNVLKDYGRIDVLINCAGINKREGFLDVEEETFDKIMGINLKGVFFLTQLVVKNSMMKTGGKIINVGSYNTTSMLGGVSVYGATKSAVWALTRSMAIEWAKFNIQANCIAPGHILTPLTKVTWENENRANYLRERIAMERPGTPEEILGVVVLLSSPASSYLTGELYNIDGGALAGGKPWQFDTKY